MALEAGSKLGHYEIVSSLGAGGMGEVYRAKDTKLGREVAIKVLLEEVSADPERLARFEREARVLASLNHNNIASLHAFERDGDTNFLVMEVVEGETLADRIKRGAIPVDEALPLFVQIAEGLEAAHENGVIHRDLKPANIKVSDDGNAKILDFGLAKAMAPEKGSPGNHASSMSPTLTLAATQRGEILGTAAYMSPEQASGRPVDKKTDIWAFGCCLYEAVSGRSVFGADTAPETMARVLEREPSWSDLPSPLPAGLETLLRRCLQKNPHLRLHDIADARIALSEPDRVAGPTEAVPPTRAFSLSTAMAAGLVALGLAAGVTLSFLLGGGFAATDTEAGIGSLPTDVARVTHEAGLSEWPTWSNDGSAVAFASDRNGDFEVYVRRIAGGSVINVTNHAAQDIQPALSPDGENLAFISTRSSKTGPIRVSSSFRAGEFRTFGGDLWMVPSLGGGARRLAEDANAPDWHPDSRKVAYVTGAESKREIRTVDIDSGETRVLLEGAVSSWEITRLRYSLPS